jgi:hypothetical protein
MTRGVEEAGLRSVGIARNGKKVPEVEEMGRIGGPGGRRRARREPQRVNCRSQPEM